MTHDASWRELYRCDDLDHASMIVTCLNAMEFPTKLLDARGNLLCDLNRKYSESSFAIEVPRRDWEALIEVLPEIIEEQRQFDADLNDFRNRSARRERHWLALLVAIVIVLAMFGLIDL